MLGFGFLADGSYVLAEVDEAGALVVHEPNPAPGATASFSFERTGGSSASITLTSCSGVDPFYEAGDLTVDAPAIYTIVLTFELVFLGGSGGNTPVVSSSARRLCPGIWHR